MAQPKILMTGGGGAIARATLQHAAVSGAIRTGKFPVEVWVDPGYAKTKGSSEPDMKRIWLHLTNCPQRMDVEEQLPDLITIGGDSTLVVDGKPVEVIVEDHPGKYASAVKDTFVYEASGLGMNDARFVQSLVEAGAHRVGISAPAKHAKQSMVFGLDHTSITTANIAQLIAYLSCTTHAISFPIAVVAKKWGVAYGFMLTIHAYTADQRLHDAPHKDARRGIGIDGTLLDTTTGAAGAVGLALPHLAGRLDGFSIRGPWANGSEALILLVTESKVETGELHAALTEASKGFSDRMAVTAREDYTLRRVVGDPHASVVDIGLGGDGFTRALGIKPSFDSPVARDAMEGLLTIIRKIAGEDNAALIRLSSAIRAAVFGSVIAIDVKYDNVWGTSEGYRLGTQYLLTQS